MTCREDECRIRTDHAPENMVTLRHVAANLTRAAPPVPNGPDSIRQRIHLASMNDGYLLSVLAA